MHIENFDPYDFKKKEVNGVTIYYKNLPWAPCIHINFSFSAGAFSDPVGKEGVAHFLEHTVFDGSPLIPDKKAMHEFSRLYMLNTQNAFTGRYRTKYVGKCLPEHFERVFETMSDYIFRPLLREEDIEHERKVIIQEAWGTYKNEKYLKYIKEVEQNMYSGHQRSRISSPLGWPDTVTTITQEDIASFHKAYYVKENVRIFLVGAIEETDMAIVEENVKMIPSGKKATVESGIVQKPLVPRFDKTGDEIGDPREQVEFGIGRVVSGDYTKSTAAMEQTGRLLQNALFERLRTEKSLCYGVSAGISVYKDYAESGISVNTDENKLEIVEKEVWNIINEIKEGTWQDRFVELHKLRLDQIRSGERLSGDVIIDAVEDVMLYERVITLEETLDELAKVTYKDLQNMLTLMFDPEFVFTEIIRPSKKATA